MKNKVSIILATHNGSAHIRQAIESVLEQSFIDFKFLIIDDGSTDNTESIIQEYSLKDDRITYLKNEKNMGLTKSLNKGLLLTKGKYIARIDDDDMREIDKLEKQVSFLESNPGYGIVGTNFKYINSKGTVIGARKKYETDKKIRNNILRRNPFVHVAVMFRRSIITKAGTYNETCKVGQDYDLWLRVGEVSKMYNIQETLTTVRLRSKSISTTHVKEQHKLGFQKCLEYRSVYPNFIYSFIHRLFLLIIPSFLLHFLFTVKEKIEIVIKTS